jgi:DNA-binding transcriptional ArsR family regulator
MTVATHRPPPPLHATAHPGLHACLHGRAGILGTVTPTRRSAHTHASDLTFDEHVVVMAELFDLLSGPTRLRLLLQLREANEACVSDLAAGVATSESAISHALRLLRAAGLVASERRGRHIYYRLADEHARVVLDATLAHLRTVHTRSAAGRSRARRRPSVA